MRYFIYGVIAVLGAKLFTLPLSAEGALAVGLPEGDPKNGFAYHLVTNKPVGDAGSIAVSKCKEEDNRKGTARARGACKVIETFSDECVNVAWNGGPETVSTAVGWGSGPNKKTADERAMRQCESMRKGKGRDCRPDGEPLCDGAAKK